MVQKKLAYTIKRISTHIKSKLELLNLSTVIMLLGYLLLIVVLAVNAYTSYNRGMANLEKLAQEQIKTAKLQNEYDELSNLYQYYSSIDYKKMYARDNLNLAERNETLYYIEKHEAIDIETLPNTTKPKKIDNLLLWRKLIFGV
jgi:cell division protein FtsB